jgi:very-short-patch-repair endonuclease
MRPRRDSNPRLKTFARSMRHEATDTERKLWSILRDRQLEEFKFRRQHPIAGFIVDFYCVKVRLAIELDGSQHQDESAQEYDQKRTERLDGEGVRVIRFSDEDVLKDPFAVAETILREIGQLVPSPLPSPGVPGEGVKS